MEATATNGTIKKPENPSTNSTIQLNNTEHVEKDEVDDEEEEPDEDAIPDGVTNGKPTYPKFYYSNTLSGAAKKKKKKKKSKKKKLEQSNPPRVGLSKLFPSNVYPEGELQPYKDE